jgi:hypothetical protein
MSKRPHVPSKMNPTRAPRSKAARAPLTPIGPALAELLNPAINRGESGIGSSTGLKQPPDNSKERRSGDEAAVHRSRASTRGTSDDVAKRDASPAGGARGLPPPNPPPQAGEGSRRLAERDDASSSPPPAREARGGVRGEQSSLSRSGVGGGPASSTGSEFAGGGEKTEPARSRPPPRAPASANPPNANSRLPITAHRPSSPRSIRSWQNNSASPRKRKTWPRWRGRRATRWRRSALPQPPTRWTL